MNFKEKLTKVLQKLNLMDKAKEKTLTHEEWQAIVNSYQEEFKVTLQDDLEAEQASHIQPVMTQEQMDRVQKPHPGASGPDPGAVPLRRSPAVLLGLRDRLSGLYRTGSASTARALSFKMFNRAFNPETE